MAWAVLVVAATATTWAVGMIFASLAFWAPKLDLHSLFGNVVAVLVALLVWRTGLRRYTGASS
ncbi:hypothetical protein ACWEOE_09585 [Amycolatopsis sp. NPDC004368]